MASEVIDVQVTGWRAWKQYRFALGPLHPYLVKSHRSVGARGRGPMASACVLSLQWNHLRLFGRTEDLAGRCVSINGTPIGTGVLVADTRQNWSQEGRHNLRLTEEEVGQVERLARPATPRETPLPTHTAQDRVVPYDPEQHLLLGQIAHRARLTPEERSEFYELVRATMPDHYRNVDVPDWPPVPYAPLALIMQVGDGSGSDGPWWEDHFWTGEQPAIPARRSHHWTDADGREHGNLNAHGHCASLAREMAGSGLSPRRLAYAWEVREFDASRDVLIRPWIENRGLSVADWWMDFWPRYRDERAGAIVQVANPHAEREQRETGQWSPIRRALRRDHRRLLLEFAGSVGPGAPALPDHWTPEAPVEHEREPMREPTGYAAGSRIYSAEEVAEALERIAGKRPRFFSGRPSDDFFVCPTYEQARRFIADDRSDREQYLKSGSGAQARNRDCEQFAVRVMSNLHWQTGINGCGVIAADTHAWVFVLTADNRGNQLPGVLMFEAITDEVVKRFTGDYSIDKRFEVFI